MIGAWIRREAFWIVDKLRSSSVKSAIQHLEQIKECTIKQNKVGVNELIKHAIATVPFYERECRGVCNINEFPVVSKDVYRKEYEAFRSRSYLKDEQLHAVYTSGSTGNPFKAFQDKDKIVYHQAGLISLNKSIGWELGEKYMFIRAWGSHASGKMKNFATNVVPIEATNLTRERISDICNRLMGDKNLGLILGYASSLEMIADYAIEHNLEPANFNIRLIISDSECLKSNAKKKIKKVFGCPVLNRYANNENGIIALTDNDTDCFKVNYAEYYVELLKLNSDDPVTLGEVGRIVITDIYNKAFPFIRYDTGDLGIANKMCGRQVLEFSQIVGRISDSLTTVDGILLGESVVAGKFENYTPLHRYQVIQEGNKYKILIEKPFLGEEIELLRRAAQLFGESAHVAIEYTDLIPRQSNGKFKTTVRKK